MSDDAWRLAWLRLARRHFHQRPGVPMRDPRVDPTMLVDPGPDTPCESKPWALFGEMARDLIPRLEDAALVKSKPGAAVDSRGSRRAREIAAELRELAEHFDSWPTADAETVAMERASLPAKLMDLNREALELLASIPKTWPPR